MQINDERILKIDHECDDPCQEDDQPLPKIKVVLYFDT